MAKPAVRIKKGMILRIGFFIKVLLIDCISLPKTSLFGYISGRSKIFQSLEEIQQRKIAENATFPTIGKIRLKISKAWKIQRSKDRPLRLLRLRLENYEITGLTPSQVIS
jgi:hypothetical protein